MEMHVTTNSPEIAGWLKELYSDQIPFATSKAINAVTLHAQREQRGHMADVFTLRRKPFADRSVKISQFARKTTLFAEIRIETPGDPGRSDIFTQHEEANRKRPSGRSLAVPDLVRRTKAGIVPKNLRPRALRLRPHGTSGNVAVGMQRTVLIRKPGGKGGIYQRVGRGKGSSLRRLYGFAPDMPIKPALKFHETIRTAVTTRIEDEFTKAFDAAVRSAK